MQRLTRAFTIRVTPELLADLHRVAEAEERTVAQVMRLAARQYVESNGRAQ